MQGYTCLYKLYKLYNVIQVLQCYTSLFLIFIHDCFLYTGVKNSLYKIFLVYIGIQYINR